MTTPHDTGPDTDTGYAPLYLQALKANGTLAADLEAARAEVERLRRELEQQRCGACRLFKPACQCADKAADQRDAEQTVIEECHAILDAANTLDGGYTLQSRIQAIVSVCDQLARLADDHRAQLTAARADAARLRGALTGIPPGDWASVYRTIQRIAAGDSDFSRVQDWAKAHLPRIDAALAPAASDEAERAAITARIPPLEELAKIAVTSEPQAASEPPAASGEATVKYEVRECRQQPGDWAVEAINYAGDGEIYAARFTGPKARERAEEYAAWKQQSPCPKCGQVLTEEGVGGEYKCEVCGIPTVHDPVAAAASGEGTGAETRWDRHKKLHGGDAADAIQRAPPPAPFKVEVGGRYRTRDGLEVEITSWGTGTQYPACGHYLHPDGSLGGGWWDASGRKLTSTLASAHDLIARLDAPQAEAPADDNWPADDPEAMAQLRQSEADIAAGRVVPWEQVKEELEQSPSPAAAVGEEERALVDRAEVVRGELYPDQWLIRSVGDKGPGFSPVSHLLTSGTWETDSDDWPGYYPSREAAEAALAAERERVGVGNDLTEMPDPAQAAQDHKEHLVRLVSSLRDELFVANQNSHAWEVSYNASESENAALRRQVAELEREVAYRAEHIQSLQSLTAAQRNRLLEQHRQIDSLESQRSAPAGEWREGHPPNDKNLYALDHGGECYTVARGFESLRVNVVRHLPIPAPPTEGK